MKTITGIHGVPRSGTSWLGQIYNSHPNLRFKFQPLFSYRFKDYLSMNSSQEDVKSFFDLIYETDDDFVNMRDPQIHKNYPVFSKANFTPHLAFKHVRYHFLLEHLLEMNDQLKLILIIRNPMAVLHSWHRSPREFNPDWNLLKEWKSAGLKNIGAPENYFGFNKWKEAALIFHKIHTLFPNRTYLLKYDDLLSSPVKVTEKLFAFSGLDLTEQTINFIKESREKDHADDPNSVYRKKDILDSEFIGKLPEEIVFEIKNTLKNTELEEYLPTKI